MSGDGIVAVSVGDVPSGPGGWWGVPDSTCDSGDWVSREKSFKCSKEFAVIRGMVRVDASIGDQIGEGCHFR